MFRFPPLVLINHSPSNLIPFPEGTAHMSPSAHHNVEDFKSWFAFFKISFIVDV